MSDGDVIVISSDEDSDSVKVSEENKPTNNIDAAQTSNDKFENNEANEISFIDHTKSSVNTISEKTEKENVTNQSGHSYSIAIKCENTADSIEVIENNFFGNESEIFKKFMTTVLTLEHEEKNKTKLVKKLSKYHKLADPNYVRSFEFNELLQKGIEKINENSVYLYFVLKEVKDCLISNRVEFKFKKNTKGKILSSDENVPEKTSEENNLGNEDERKYKTVNKLTALLAKVGEKIKELEEMEVDFSDEEDSSYFKMQRYRERYCQVYEKLCTYTNQPLNGNRVGGFRKINFSDTDNLELNRAIEKWLNKTKQFPDYSDVNKFMAELNQSLSLKLTKEQVKIRAQQIFEKIGNMLQRRRHFDLWDSLSSFLSTDVDPAIKNPELDSLLQKNFELGIKKEKELLRYYVEKQESEKLQPREVPDEEANCSPTESGDEDEKEIEIVENMLDSKISTDDDEDGDENEERSDEEAGHDSVCHSDSKISDNDWSKMDAKPETEVTNDNCMQIDNVGSNGIDPHARVDSEKPETIGTDNRESFRDENVVGAMSSTQHIEVNPILCRSKNLMKRKNENLNEHENENINIHPFKRFLEDKEMTETKNISETKIIQKSDSDSDCEIVEVISGKKDETKKTKSLERKVYTINYAFINNTFNYNTILSSNIFRKRHCFLSNYKNMNNQKSFYDLPLNDLTNIKSITNKYARYKENKMKRKLKNIFNKPKFFNSTNSQASKGSDLKNNDLTISMDKNSISCALQQENSAENMKSQKEVNKTNKSNDLQQGSSDEMAMPPNGGCSSGGNGQDNSENNGNKKPFDQEKQTEDTQENEEKEEDEEEGSDSSEKKLPQTSGATDPAAKLFCSGTETYPNEKKDPCAAQFNLPPTQKVLPLRRKSFGKQWEKPRCDIAKGKQTLSSPPTTISPRTRPSPIPKRKVNQNGGIQGASRQSNFNASAVQVKRASTDLMKPDVNKVFPTASSSNDDDDDVEIIQVTKKKRSMPAKAVQSDEEIVKNFLQRSHPSISITTPKKRPVQKEPPPSVLQALETLRRLKGISTTIVKGSSKYNTDEDVTVIGESLSTRVNQISKLQKTPPPSTTATTSFDSFIPKIVTVQGNVAGFEDIVDDSTIIEQDFYPECVQNPQAHFPNVHGSASNYEDNSYGPQARLANVSGSASNYEENFTGTVECIPIPRFRNVKSRSRRTPKNKSKNVEYVILD